ncbi:MAG: type II toxin-antitoxin system RelE/ParE family toxin [Pseudomonadales bacterium]|nr:type II toxin-antitoxin system RelE/ParE family toxin [Candidatus Woesebacteria bacterium]MCB9801996.1 type II toxin-antitoxin system RelE/ParE family toxin [Pseudomonadales bacterium]
MYTNQAIKDIKKLDAVSKKKLGKKILLYVADLLVHARKLVHSDLGSYRWRVGKLRVVFDLDEHNTTIVVLRVRFRRDIYR